MSKLSDLLSSSLNASYTTTIGDGINTSITVTHNLNTSKIFTMIKESSSGVVVYPDITHTSSTQTVISFASAPTTNQYFVSMVGV